ncbi:MAG: alginate export family protein [Pseudomonadota bacterium]|nr:alginate export family protein [Pseudomonadota bacterium]
MRLIASACVALLSTTAAVPAIAGPLDPVELGEGVTLDPILDARLRLETADQSTQADTATSVTVRARAGAELKISGFSIIAEGEFTGALEDDYNDTIPGNGIEPFPVIADPESAELNRLSIGYKAENFGAILGRQRIIHEDARFIGNVGWRQNEQTFDAVRATADLGPVEIDQTYAIGQRTIFGSKSPNQEFEGDFIFTKLAADIKPVRIAAYRYEYDYDTRIAFSSQTYGATISGSVPTGPVKLGFKGSYASQSDTGLNPTDYSADYFLAEGSVSYAGFTLRAQYEELGSDNGIAAFQTPLATAHKFNGYADLFLVTPATGLRDSNVRLSKKFAVEGLPSGINVQLTYHEFDSDFGGLDYGTEFDAVVSAKFGPVAVLAKYGNYQTQGFGPDTTRFTIQGGISF